MRSKINVIGDSHAFFFAGTGNVHRTPFAYGINIPLQNISEYAIYHVGPALAYNLPKTNTTVRANEKIHYLLDANIVKQNDTCIFVFGEIDCRYHLPKRFYKNNIEKIVSECIQNYLLFLESISKYNINIYIFGPIATQKDTMPMNKHFPRYGTEVDRNRITFEFNKQLLLSMTSKIKFFNI